MNQISVSTSFLDPNKHFLLLSANDWDIHPSDLLHFSLINIAGKGLPKFEAGEPTLSIAKKWIRKISGVRIHDMDIRSCYRAGKDLGMN